ncbi:DUF222 domain-containing protein [Kribbella sp. NPDC059898]|uniref:HNH endonuclease signature motif containing protein n=1 Tax=Kribbella sp. NPDC059898 TaxID=3346995 RepID=UPI003655BBF5
MDILGRRPVVAIGNHEVLPALDEANAEIIRLQAVRLQLIARAETDGLAQELGARDTVELLTFRHRHDRTEAWRDVHLARALPKYKAVDAALTNDTPIQTGHAAAIITELERVRSRVPIETLDVTEQQLVGLASHLTPKELRTAAKQLCDRIDADGREPEEQKASARESLTLITAENGVKFRGYLANDNAELLRAIVHAGARPHKTVDGEHDPRPRDKRQADALTTALTVAANAWDTDTASHGAKANITITIDLDDLKSATANATGQTIYSDDLSAATIRRLACDTNIMPLVLGSNSQPLDVSRSERLVTRHIRHALTARDRGCVVCATPPVMCDAHHLTHWADGGPTALTNLALLCRRHHVDLHNDRWHITITNGKPHVARPTWADPTPRPNLPQPPKTTPLRRTPSDSAPPESTPRDSAPPESTPRDSAPPDSAPLGPIPPVAPPPESTPPHSAPPESAPRESTPRESTPSDSARPGPVPPVASPRDAVRGTALPEPPAPEAAPHEAVRGMAPPGADAPGTAAPEPAPDCAAPGESPLRGIPLPRTAPEGGRPSRWRADAATYAEAARFAVWNGSQSNEPSTGPPSFATT